MYFLSVRKLMFQNELNEFEFNFFISCLKIKNTKLFIFIVEYNNIILFVNKAHEYTDIRVILNN